MSNLRGAMDSSLVDTTFITYVDTVVQVVHDTLYVVPLEGGTTTENGLAWLHTPVLLLVTISGWGVVHYLSIKAQREHHRDMIRNEAREAIGDAIARYQRWLEAYSAIVEFLWQGNLLRENKVAELAAHLKDEAAFDWVNRIVEYELLFPKLAEIANGIRNQHVMIRNSVENVLKSTKFRIDGSMEGTQEQINATALAVKETNALYTKVFQVRRSLQVEVLGKIFPKESKQFIKQMDRNNK